MNKLLLHKEKHNNGFTLVELIVVLAILSILATMLIPALTGYIDKTNGKKLVAKARSLYTVSQSVVSEQYAINSSFEKSTSYFERSDMNVEIIALSEVDGDYECYIALDAAYRVSELFYKENDKLVYLQDGSFEVAEGLTKPSATNIAIKTTLLRVPGSYYTELANLGKYSSDSDKQLLLSVEEMQREAIKIYQQNKRTGMYAYDVRFTNGVPYIDRESRDSRNYDRSSNSVVNCGDKYIIIIDGNKITTNIYYKEESKEVRVRDSHIFLTKDSNTFRDFNPWESY